MPRAHKEGTKTERFLDLLFLLLEAKAPVPMTKFDDPKWGDKRTFYRLYCELNEAWKHHRGRPLFEIVDADGRPTLRGERFMRLVDVNMSQDIELTAARRLFAMSAVMELGRIVKGTLFQDEYQPLLTGFSQKLNTKAKRHLQFIDRKFYYLGKGMKDYSKAGVREVLDDIYTAIMRNWLLELERGTGSDTERVVVKPLTLLMFNSGLYVITLRHDQTSPDEIRTWKIESIRSTKVLKGKEFAYPESYDPHRVFGSSFGLMHSAAERSHKVELRFSAESFVQQYVKERRWTGGEKYHKDEQGRLIMKFTTRQLDEVASFVLSFGAHAEVLEPEVLRKQVAGSLRKAVALYRGSVT